MTLKRGFLPCCLISLRDERGEVPFLVDITSHCAPTMWSA